MMLQPDQIEKLTVLAQRVSAKHITQLRLSEVTGIHQSQISRILAGDVRRASKNVLKLCKYAETVGPLDRDVRSAQRIDFLSLLGRSPAEDAALSQVMASLYAWRQTWAGDR